MSTGELVDESTPKWAGTPPSTDSPVPEVQGTLAANLVAPYMDVMTVEDVAALRARGQAAEDRIARERAATQAHYVGVPALGTDAAGAAAAVKRADTALAAANDQLDRTQANAITALAGEQLLLDRLAGGDESVSSVELVAAAAANVRAGLLRDAAAAAVTEADNARIPVRLAEIEIQARILATSDDLAQIEAARQAVIDAEKHRDTLDAAWNDRIQATGEQLRDVGFPMIDTSLPLEQTGWIGYTRNGPVAGFRIDGQTLRVRPLLTPEDVYGRR